MLKIPLVILKQKVYMKIKIYINFTVNKFTIYSYKSVIIDSSAEQLKIPKIGDF